MAGKAPDDTFTPVTLQGNEGNYQSVDDDGNALVSDLVLPMVLKDLLGRLDEILNQLKILNAYNALGYDAELTIEDTRND